MNTPRPILVDLSKCLEFQPLRGLPPQCDYVETIRFRKVGAAEWETGALVVRKAPKGFR